MCWFKEIYRCFSVTLKLVVALIFICWAYCHDRLISWTSYSKSMTRQMGNTENVGCCLKEQIGKNAELEDKIQNLEKTIEEQHEMIEKQFGKDVERTVKGKCNNAGEMIQPTSLSMKCREMFDEEWRNVMKISFQKEKELLGIQFLSWILEHCQDFCQTKAMEHLNRFINPLETGEDETSVKEVFPSSEEQHYLYKLRRTICLRQANQEALIDLFWAECKQNEAFQTVMEKSMNDNEVILDDYIRSCCGICWQSAISDPPVVLKFDVVGKPLEEIRETFQSYHFKCDSDEKGVAGTVKQVVWPATMLRDGDNDILIDNAKGSVLVYASSAV